MSRLALVQARRDRLRADMQATRLALARAGGELGSLWRAGLLSFSLSRLIAGAGRWRKLAVAALAAFAVVRALRGGERQQATGRTQT
ncbi:hypothetical protein [Ramlibacter albus]|uniref:YqjK-like family protein n=1 Tax=Ramlibacter albus TaxID=2079448 RepID=A0A923S160_9BURK|nr:hypothetical protein [Ramlibacter albus]MBC5763941.1 hypothetical protein [Ramlibacter albus]